MDLNSVTARPYSPEGCRQLVCAGGGAVGFGLAAPTGRRSQPISWIRVKKFVTTTSFATCQTLVHGFHPQATLEEGLRITLDAEFKNPDPTRAVFLTE